ncbi:unnamed protein product [Acanthoscelides obtectus]|uniref:G-patch domain-containing protein n=1 Tax=Acanthoscelides obtectus TaxID=200917 RepID=A0A9P0L5D4_ACAOB|nr:unnamed protein product [Acanthoscelides obtectus]CAK1673071.1 hypothetical protein AOBTE_LOCUS29231 [Acanthoscelides obtectus]
MSNRNYYSRNQEHSQGQSTRLESWNSNQYESKFRQNNWGQEGSMSNQHREQWVRGRRGCEPCNREERGYDRNQRGYTTPGGDRRQFRGRGRGFYSRQNTPYDRPTNSRRFKDNVPSEEINTASLSPLDIKVNNLINAVQSQHPVIGQIIFTQICNENPTVLLQNAIQALRNCTINVLQNQQSGLYELKINGDKFAEGPFPSAKQAKSTLFENVFHDLKDKCFLITKKRNYEEVTTDEINKVKEEGNAPSSSNDLGENSKAYQMMLKMGWGGKGLGSQEQGQEKTVAELITENITKEGLGSKNVMEEIDRIMREFAQSTKLSTLAFDSSFTKEERARMHTLV